MDEGNLQPGGAGMAVFALNTIDQARVPLMYTYGNLGTTTF